MPPVRRPARFPNNWESDIDLAPKLISSKGSKSTAESEWYEPASASHSERYRCQASGDKRDPFGRAAGQKVLESLKRLENSHGVTVKELKRYVSRNEELDVEALHKAIDFFIRKALKVGTVTSKGGKLKTVTKKRKSSNGRKGKRGSSKKRKRSASKKGKRSVGKKRKQSASKKSKQSASKKRKRSDDRRVSIKKGKLVSVRKRRRNKSKKRKRSTSKKSRSKNRKTNASKKRKAKRKKSTASKKGKRKRRKSSKTKRKRSTSKKRKRKTSRKK